MGDFEIHYNKVRDGNREKLRQIVEGAGLRQIFDRPTRITSLSVNTIDLVITNMYGLTLVDTEFPQLTNHSFVGTRLDSDSRKSDRVVTFRDLHSDNLRRINRELVGMTWNNNCTDLEILYEDFKSNIMKVVNEVSPEERKVIPNNRKE
ncbi:hypothetical protein HHI36_003585 [Cryptolaemus montrouzieri]|uniref:Uncharacterized protein n=1 Tax=Cryptolaemus montrouzieri TaxID=559131 RepID=A0ABD2PEB5_9CUCU